MSLKAEIKSFIKEQKEVIKNLVAMDKSLDKLEKDIELHISKAWKSTKQSVELHIVSLQGGSHSTEFEMDVFIDIVGYKVIGQKLVQSKFCEGTIIDKPPTIKFLRDFAKQMTKELGINVKECVKLQPTQRELEKKVEKYGIKSFEDANIYFKNDLDLIREGSVYYKGWEISDLFYICKKKSNGDLVLLYSTNGHGGGIDKVVVNPTLSEMDMFLEHVEQDSDNLNVRSLVL